MRIILASKSPRRVEILRQIGAEFEIMPADIDESVSETLLPEDAVSKIAERKAVFIREKLKSNNVDEFFIISADTVVVADGKIIGKPQNDKNAYEILKGLSGKTHRVLTGFTLCIKDKVYTSFESTQVNFRELSDDEIYQYIKSGEPADKAGAYGIQEKGSVFVESISGDYFNVMGLPVCRINKVAKEIFNIGLAKF